MKHLNFSLIFFALLVIFNFTACKKQSVVSNLVAVTPSDTTGNSNLVLDSTLLLTKDIYLWYNQIPSTFNARSYADPIKEMEAIRQYSVEPGFSSPVDKWSFAVKKVDWDNESNGIVMSNSN